VVLVKYRSLARKAFARQPGMQSSLFNAPAIDSAQDLYVTEGEFDCAVLTQAGLRSVSIGSTTTPVTPKMLDQIKKAKRVILAGDNDPLGVAKMQDLQTRIPGSLILRWPGCKDANEMWLRDRAQDFIPSGTKLDSLIDGFRNKVIGLVVEAEKETI
jgi:hypothetical protein